jgi:hypothetical protein
VKDPRTPKAFNHPAKGCRVREATLVRHHTHTSNLENVESVPHVALIVINAVFLEELSKLFLKRNLPMMLVLIGDAIPGSSFLRSADGKYPYPLCQENSAKSGNSDFIHTEEARFNSLITSATVPVRDMAKSKWTWSSTPPTMRGWQSLLVSIPPRYLCSSCRVSRFLRNGRRSFVEKTACKRIFANDCAMNHNNEFFPI